MKSQELSIQGMTCGHCIMHVKKALSSLPGVQVEDVKIGTARISIDEHVVTGQNLADAVAKAGYSLTSVK